MTLSEADPVEVLYEQNLYQQAFKLGCELFGELRDWKDQLLAGKVAAHVGSPRTGDFLVLRAGRREPNNAAAQSRAALAIQRRFGPWEAFCYLRDRERLLSPKTSTKDLLAWHSAMTDILVDFRDFQEAREHLAIMKEASESDEWTMLSEVALLQAEDRNEDALLLSGVALREHPSSRPLLQQKAYLLEELGRPEEAVELLRQALPTVESCWIVAQLAQLLNSLERFQEALLEYQRFKSLQLLPDKGVERWLNAGLFRCHYRTGDARGALEHVGKNPGPAQLKLLDNLKKAGPEDRRVELPMEYVRQHHSTCGPATVTTIARYWGKEVDHLELANEICYDGTSHSALREWAVKNGWSAREFTLDWETTKSLINRQLPIALTTVETDSAHLQAVCGFDEALGLILLRDSSSFAIREGLAEKFFERYAFCGPRAMLLLPEEESGRLDLELPDAELFDLHYRLEQELEADNRARAEQTAALIRTQAPDHRLNHYAELALALYDENLYGQLEALKALRQIFPDSDSLTYREFMILNQLGLQVKARELLEKRCATAGATPFEAHLAGSLLANRENHDRAAKLLRKTMNLRRDSSTGYYYLGVLRWQQKQLDESLRLKRIASCLKDLSEGLALEYFEECHKLDRTDTGLSYLAARRERYEDKRPGSGQTYITALEQLGQTDKAHQLLDELLLRHPEDSGLNLFAADFHARYGDFDKAQKHLEEARFNTSELSLLRAAAKLELYRGRLSESAELWQKIVRREPTASDAITALCNCYRMLGDEKRSAEAVGALMQKYPQNVPLKRLYFAVQDDPDECRAVLESLLELTPNDSWAWSRYAFNCELLGLGEKSDEALQRALRLAPNDSSVRLCQAQILYRRGQLDPARQACREAIRCNLGEAAPAITMLVQELCAEPEERPRELEYLWNQIVGQTADSNGAYLLYQSLAEGSLDEQETYRRLQTLGEKRPHSLEIVIALVNQARSMGRLDEALDLAEKATVRFPHDTLAWNKLSELHRQSGRVEEERRCLKKALAVEPTASLSIRRLAENLRLSDRLTEALELLTLGAATNPQDPLMLGVFAEVQWLSGQRDLALDTLQRAVKIDSNYIWAWNKLATWSTERDSARTPVSLARELVAERPNDSTNWLRLFEFLPQDAHEEKLDALDHALALSPLDTDLHDAKISFLAELGRYEEAFQACTPEVWGERAPLPLQGRRCWLWAHMGKLEEAVKEMNKLLEKEPDYYFGLLMTAHWQMSLNRGIEALICLQKAVELQPESADALLLLAQALEQQGEDSRETLRRALRADPTEAHLLHHLLEADLERQDAEAVRRDANEWAHLLLPEERTLYLLILDCSESNQKSFEDRLTELARTGKELWVFDRALKHALDSNYGKVARKVFEGVGASGEGTREAGMRYHSLLKHLGVPNVEKLLRELPVDTAFRAGVLGSCLDDLDHSDFKKLLDENRDEIRRDTYCWGQAMRAMFTTPKPDYGEIVQWSDDWEQRVGLESWMLCNRATALREKGRIEEAHQLLVWADENLAVDHGFGHLKTSLAWGYLEKGKIERALLNLKAAPRESLSEYYQVVHALVEASLSAHEGRIDQCKESVAEAWKVLGPNHWDGSLKRLHRETLEALLSRKPGLGARFWAVGQVVKREQLWVLLGPIAVLASLYLRQL